MRRIWAVLLAGLLALTVVAVVPATAKSPARGDIDLMLVTSCGAVTWSGTVTVDGQPRGLVLEYAGVPGVFRGQSYHYEEYFTVTAEPIVAGTCPTGSETMLLTGWDFGLGVLANRSMYGDNGVVTDTSEGYSMWLGRKVRMSGDMSLTEVAPGVFVETLDGVFQLN